LSCCFQVAPLHRTPRFFKRHEYGKRHGSLNQTGPSFAAASLNIGAKALRSPEDFIRNSSRKLASGKNIKAEDDCSRLSLSMAWPRPCRRREGRISIFSGSYEVGFQIIGSFIRRCCQSLSVFCALQKFRLRCSSLYHAVTHTKSSCDDAAARKSKRGYYIFMTAIVDSAHVHQKKFPFNNFRTTDLRFTSQAFGRKPNG
jgi:hypothetical protein